MGIGCKVNINLIIMLMATTFVSVFAFEEVRNSHVIFAYKTYGFVVDKADCYCLFSTLLVNIIQQ